MLLPSRDRRISRSVVSVLLNNIQQLMRRKFVIILAVPALFLLTLLVLMSDVGSLPETSVVDKPPRTRPSSIPPPRRAPIDPRRQQSNPDPNADPNANPNPNPNPNPNNINRGNKFNNGDNNDDVIKATAEKIENEWTVTRPPRGGSRTSSRPPSISTKGRGSSTGEKEREKEKEPDNHLDHSPNPPTALPPSRNEQGGEDERRGEEEGKKVEVDSPPAPINSDPILSSAGSKVRGDTVITRGREDSVTPERAAEIKRRQDAVRNGYLHAYNSYKRYAWGQDELKPRSHGVQNWMDMGLSIVDSIDTMYLMDLKDEYEESREWIATHLNFNTEREISFFETTIRVVGGLLSIHDLTGDKMFLEKAKELGEKLMPAFGTPSGVPFTTVALKSGRAHNPSWAGSSSILSEAGTVQMEFSSLSKHTGIGKFGEKAVKVYDVLDRAQKPDGLYPVYVDSNNGGFRNRRITLGALGDSFYEYLLKLWILTGKKNDQYRRMYDEAMAAVIGQLVKTSTPSGLVYIAEKDGNIVDKMDHLVCFAGAMFALGAYHNATEDVELHMELGKQITRTCHEFYARMPSGLSPELVKFQDNKDFYSGANHYILRPETVESYFVLYWITGDPMYQDWGWEAFQAMEKHCRTPDGYAGVRDVTRPETETDDLQQSFFMAETLKYLYLLFSPRSKLDLNTWVFNTEAHPLKGWNF